MSRIALVKPEKAKQLEMMLLRAGQTGKIVGKVTEPQLISMLEEIGAKTAEKEPTIKVTLIYLILK